ncbi:hypothetical protein, partial [Aeromonas hydrophila]|uniref:hypothetical protein n=1 Tax=Aeromonas hydrophila TaxID=644 RepID=UPI00195531AA
DSIEGSNPSLTAKLQKTDLMVGFLLWGKNYQLMSKREGKNPRRVRALVRQVGRIAHLDGQRPPAGRAPGME